MPKLLLPAAVRLVLILCAGFAGLALKKIPSGPAHVVNSLTHPATIFAALAGVALFILFLDMANFGYSAIKLKQYPPLGLRYVPSFGSSKTYVGVRAVAWGLVALILGLVLSFVVVAGPFLFYCTATTR